MTEKQAIDICREKDLLNRMTFSLVKNAKAFLTDAAPANVALAKLIRDNPETYAPRFALMALATLAPASLAGLTDVQSISQASIDSQVIALWPTFAA